MKDKAKKLYDEHVTEYTFYPQSRKNGFIQRLKNLASKIDLNNDSDAVQYLDIIALRLEIDLNPFLIERV